MRMPEVTTTSAPSVFTTGAFRPLIASGLPTVDMQSYGATFDGVTDDLEKCQAAYDAAYLIGGTKATVTGPAGKTAILGGQLFIKCNTAGGFTFKSKTGNSVGQSPTVPADYDGIELRDFTVDGNFSGEYEAVYAGTFGLKIHSNHVHAYNVTAQNTFGPSFYVGMTNQYHTTGVELNGCTAFRAYSRETGSSPIVYGDGVASQWTDGLVVRGCTIQYVMRAGIVFEGDATLKSINAVAEDNRISYCAGAGSGGQTNGAIWFEHTLSGYTSGNVCTSTGWGITYAPTNGSAEASFISVGDRFYGGNGPGVVFNLSGEKTCIRMYGTVVSGLVSPANQTVLVSGGGGDILLSGFYFGAYTFPNNSSAGNLVFDVAGNSTPLRSFRLENCTKEISTYPHPDSGDINIITTGGFSGNLQKLYLRDNPGSWSMLTQDPATVICSRDTILTHTAGSYPILNATRVGYSPGNGNRIYNVAGGSSTTIAPEDTEIFANHTGGSGSLGFVIEPGQPRGRTLIGHDYSLSAVGNNIDVTATGTTIDGNAHKIINTAGGSFKIQLVDGNVWQSVL